MQTMILVFSTFTVSDFLYSRCEVQAVLSKKTDRDRDRELS